MKGQRLDRAPQPRTCLPPSSALKHSADRDGRRQDDATIDRHEHSRWGNEIVQRPCCISAVAWRKTWWLDENSPFPLDARNPRVGIRRVRVPAEVIVLAIRSYLR